MPLYMSTFDYEPAVWAELINNPENRTETVSRILEDAGCKLKGLWYAFGKSDGFALIEAPDNATSASIAIVINASGAFRKFETTVLADRSQRAAPDAFVIRRVWLNQAFLAFRDSTSCQDRP
jgi:uncharacterized protein with GYD domain